MDDRAKNYHDAILSQRADWEQQRIDRQAEKEKLAKYRETLMQIRGFVMQSEETLAQDWAELFVSAAPLLRDFYVDFLIDQRLEQLDQNNASPLQSMAYLLFAWAVAENQTAIREQLQAARDAAYLGALRDSIYEVVEILDDIALQRGSGSVPIDRQPLPWTYVYRTQEDFARDLEGLAGYSAVNVRRMVKDGRLQARDAIGGKRYCATDPQEQQKILQQIRKSRTPGDM